MINHIVLIGRITADPELKHTQNGIAFCNFTLAVERNYKDSAGNKMSDFITCTAWKQQAELLNQYVKQGDMLGIEGSLQSRKYQTQDGQNRTAYEVQVSSMQFLGKGKPKSNKPKTTNERKQQKPVTPEPHPDQDRDDYDLPF
jgi:single-strand DNA-binding protein